jgi:hypothetical protein
VSNLNTTQGLIEDYLATLKSQLFPVPLGTRDEFMSEIAEHIAEGRADLDPDDVEALRALLVHLGDPAQLAGAVIADQRDQHRQLSVGQRARKLLLPLLALTAVMLLVAGGLWTAHYQPLRTVPLFQASPSITYADGKDVPQVNASSSELPGEVPVWIMPKGTSTIHISVSIENAGSFPVKITGVQSPFFGWPSMGPARVGFARDVGSSPAPRFHPFTVGAHQEWGVTLEIPMHCTLGSQTAEPTRVMISTSFAGVSHQVWVNIQPFNIEFARSC